MELIKKIEEMLLPLIADTDIFVVSMSVKPTNNIKLFLDADDGFSVQKSSMINKKIRRQIDELELFPEGDYSLEVSSPGVDEPLLLTRQYVKNIGRNIAIDLVDEAPSVLGKLIAATDEEVTVEVVTNPKKKETSEVVIPLEHIKEAIIQISF